MALDLVIDVVDDGRRVHLGLGVRVRRTADTDSAGVRIEAYVPLFAAAGSEQVASPLLLGAADGTIELELAVDMPTATAVGGVALTAVELGARIPTIGDAIPALTLALRGLRMPGAPDPTDLVVDPAALGGLGGTLTELVLALLRARTSDLPVSDPARSPACSDSSPATTCPTSPSSRSPHAGRSRSPGGGRARSKVRREHPGSATSPTSSVRRW